MLRDDIKSAMRNRRADADGTVQATFVFPADFTGFRGHFPGNPVLPGVCIVQAVLVLMEAFGSRAVELTEIVSAKFASVASANEALHFVCREQPSGDGRALVKAAVECGDRKIANLTVKISRAAGPGP